MSIRSAGVYIWCEIHQRSASGLLLTLEDLARSRATHRWVVLNHRERQNHQLVPQAVVTLEDPLSGSFCLTKWAVRALLRFSRRAALRGVLSLKVSAAFTASRRPTGSAPQSLLIRPGASNPSHASNAVAVRELCMLAPECVLPQATALAATATVQPAECCAWSCPLILCCGRLTSGCVSTRCMFRPNRCSCRGLTCDA